MTPAQMVERDRKARDEAGRKIHRPNGGPMVTTHPRGLLGEAYEECLDALNYLEASAPWTSLAGSAWYAAYRAAEMLAKEIGEVEG